MRRPRTNRMPALRGTALAGLREGTPTPPPMRPPLLTRSEALAPLPSAQAVPTAHPIPWYRRRVGGAPTWLWIAGGVTALAGIAYWQRRRIAAGASAVFDYAKRLAFKTVISKEAQPLSDLIIDLSDAYGFSPLVTYVLGERESGWGRYLKNGTGDFILRCRKNVPPGCVVVTLDAAGNPPAGWSLPRSQAGSVTTIQKSCPAGSQFVRPADGLGWGRGLLQLDWEWYYDWLSSHDWRDPKVIITRALSALKGQVDLFSSTRPIGKVAANGRVTLGADAAKRRGVAAGIYPDPRPLTGGALLSAALAAYNTGEVNVIMSLAAKKPAEYTTHGGDYVSWVMGKVTNLDTKIAAATPAAGGKQA